MDNEYTLELEHLTRREDDEALDLWILSREIEAELETLSELGF